MKKEDLRRKAEERLYETLETEVNDYSSLTGEERTKAAARIAMMADKIQKLDSNTVQENGNMKELMAKSAMIAAEVGLSVTGFVLAQKNKKFISAFEVENVIRGDAMKAASRDLLNVAGKAGSYVKRLF